VSVPWLPTEVPGLFRTTRTPSADDRGAFTKVIGEGDSGTAEPLVVREMFWSVSHTGVFRGMHFQIGSRATTKVVFVTTGVVRDIILDLRRGSPTYGRVWETELTPESGGLIVPVGCAHGFEVLRGPAVMVYGQDQHFSPESDAGINYVSAGITLMATSPIVSKRDRSLISLDDFHSPFEFA
jgi:dTDP-4-dehydrorhamnose 3,5-epimerase